MAQQRQVYLSGKFVPESEAKVSIFDNALMYGDMLFEMTRTYKGIPFRLRDHLERLYNGLKIIEIDCGLTIDEMEAATLKTIEINRPCFPEDLDFQIMHNVSRGPRPEYFTIFPEGTQPTITINCWPLTWHVGAYAKPYDTGVKAIITNQQSIPARYLDPKIKNRSRIYYQIAMTQAHHADPDGWALLTDEDGYLTEGTGCNMFLVKNGELFTPEPRNILRGVTRQAVMDLAEELGIPCHECNLEQYDAATADEMFYTSTTMAVMPATSLNGLPIGDGKPGPVVKTLQDAFSEMVGVDIIAQAKQYNEVAGNTVQRRHP